MKITTYYIPLFCLCGLAQNVEAQNILKTEQQIIYNDININRSDSFINISFEITPGAKSVKSGEQLLLTPVLYNENRRITLPSVALQSRGVQIREFRAGVHNDSTKVIRNNEKLSYSTKIAYDETLTNLYLRIERKMQQCSHISPLSTLELTDKAALVPEIIYIPHYSLPAFHQSVADSLASHHSFVAPLSDFGNNRKSSSDILFDPNMPLNMGKGLSAPQQSAVEQFIEGNEKGAIQINFSRGATTIDRFYKENNTSLVNLASVIKQIEQSTNAKVNKVVVAGFASPDGPLDRNDRLAWGRANAVREFIRSNSKISSEEILLYNGSEDWRGLYKLVEASNIEAKHEILYIINNVPILGGREKQLMSIAGGRPYKFMEQYFFPQLRNAAYIKVYYTNIGQQDAYSTNLLQAVALMDNHNYQSALTLLSTDSYTKDGVLENLIGVCYMMLGNAPQSAEYFNKALKKGNTDAGQNMKQLPPNLRNSETNR